MGLRGALARLLAAPFEWSTLEPLRGLGRKPPLSSTVERARQELWRRAAQFVGLVEVRESGGRLRGRQGRFEALLEAAPSVDGETRGTRIVVSGLRRGGPLSLRREPPPPTLPPPVGTLSLFSLPTPDLRDDETRPLSLSGPDSWDVEIGDHVFDRAVSVHGSSTLARAVLDADTRDAVAGLVGGRMSVRGYTYTAMEGEVEGGELRFVVRDAMVGLPLGDRGEARRRPSEPEEALAEVLRAALDLAARLEEPADLAQRIAENTSREPDARVRRLNVRTLVREFPDHPATRQTLLGAREDPDARVCLEAGIALGAEGRAVLLRLATEPGAEDETSARAVAALGAALSVEDARRILQAALEKERSAEAAPSSMLSVLRPRGEATARACVDALGQRGGAEAVSALARILAVESDELAIVAAEALGRTGDRVAEGPLVHALSVSPPPLRIAAARALGRVGTVASIAALREVESGDDEMRRTARQAIAEIQLRLAAEAGAAPGQLSFALGETGQVSLADPGPSGDLTLVALGPDGKSPPEGQPPGRTDDGAPPGRAGSPGECPLDRGTDE